MAETSEWRELAPGVLVLSPGPYRLNVGLLLGEERALLVDTGASLDAGRALVERARSVTELPLGAVNTHDHFDHCFGNGALDPELIWCHRLCAERVRWDGEEQRRLVSLRLRSTEPELARQIAASPIVVPGCVFDERIELDLGGRSVNLIHPGRGHTDNDAAAWVEDCGLLFAGDLVEEGSTPSFEDSYPLEWPASLATLLELSPDLVVPGHGEVVDLGFLRIQYADLEHLAQLCREGFAGGRRPWEFDSETAYPGPPAQTAIRRAYDQLTADSTGAWVERQPG